MKISFRSYNLQLKNPFGLAHGSRLETPAVLLQIEHKGITSYGEASLPPYYSETPESVMSFFSKIQLEQFENPLEIEKILSHIDKIENGNNAAKAAVDIALHDLAGKILNKPCHELFGIKNTGKILTSYTIAIDELKNLPHKIKQAASFKILKIKLGSKHDEEVVKIVKNETDKRLYADANQGWKDKIQAHEMLHLLFETGFEIAEQPMPVDSTEDDMYWLKEKSPLIILADESVKRLPDTDKAKYFFHGINIKLMKSTGMAEAYKMVLRARELDMKVMVGCMTETSCATLAASHLAPLADYVDLDGPFLIANNPFINPKLIDGCIVIPRKPGIGVELL